VAFRVAYPPEFRREAVRLLRSSRKTVPVLARELGVSPQSLRNWATQAEIDAGEREGLTSEERDELRRLRRQLPQKRSVFDLDKASSRVHPARGRRTGPAVPDDPRTLRVKALLAPGNPGRTRSVGKGLIWLCKPEGAGSSPARSAKSDSNLEYSLPELTRILCPFSTHLS
jgi:transposase